MKKFGFFGGSFNPPTHAHLKIAKESIEKFNLDKVFFVPVGNLYNKPELIDEKYRYEMLKIISKNENNIEIEDIELNLEKSISAIQAFSMIENKYKKLYNNKIETYYILGADNFINILNWKDSKQLIENYKYIIFERDNINIEEYINENKLLNENKSNFNMLKLKEYNYVSSRIIRKIINEENYKESKKYTKEEIIKYIKNNKLYKK